MHKNMISKYIYKDRYIPEEKYDRFLYEKCIKFTKCIPFMTDKMWTYIVGGITESDLTTYIHESTNTYHLQIPECKFGSYLYHTLFQYCKTILSMQTDYNCYLLYNIPKQEYIDSIQPDTVSLKAFIYFIYETHNNWHTVLNPSTNIFPKCNTIEQHANLCCVQRPITISSLHINMYVCCQTFYQSCKNNHIQCAETFINNGLVFTRDHITSIIFSNSVSFIEKMIEHGMKMNTYMIPISLVYKQYTTFAYCIHNYPSWISEVTKCIHYTHNPNTYLDAIEYVCKYYVKEITSIRDNLRPSIEYYWAYVDPKLYPETVSQYMDTHIHTLKFNTILQIESHIQKLFVR